MGLDMYAATVPARAIGNFQLDPNLKAAEKAGFVVNNDFAYWRKFNHLHGWMERLYHAKGGTEEFNCVGVRLMPEDIDRLESDFAQNKLTATRGFFFGSPELDESDAASVPIFIAKCREAFADDLAVVYSSWW